MAEAEAVVTLHVTVDEGEKKYTKSFLMKFPSSFPFARSPRFSNPSPGRHTRNNKCGGVGEQMEKKKKNGYRGLIFTQKQSAAAAGGRK